MTVIQNMREPGKLNEQTKQATILEQENNYFKINSLSKLTCCYSTTQPSLQSQCLQHIDARHVG
jgi:hypothetical protein